jgi:hypothetical protein
VNECLADGEGVCAKAVVARESMTTRNFFMRRKTLAEELCMQALSPGSIRVLVLAFRRNNLLSSRSRRRARQHARRVCSPDFRGVAALCLVLGAWDLVLYCLHLWLK